VRQPPPFTLIAHRGLSALAPENTLAAFDLALERGFDHFETDVQLTSDGALVVLHDESVGRTLEAVGGADSGGGGGGGGGADRGGGGDRGAAATLLAGRPVAECTLAELQGLDAGAWWRRGRADGGEGFMLPPDAAEAGGEDVETGAATAEADGDADAAAAGAAAAAAAARFCPPPSLDEVLLRYRGRAHIHLELKSRQPGLARAVLDALARTGWRRDLEERAAAAAAAEAAEAAEADKEEKRTGARRAGTCGDVPGLTLTSFHLEQLLRVGEELKAEGRAETGDGASSGSRGGGGGGGGGAAAAGPCFLRRQWLVQELDGATVEAACAVESGLTGICPRANAATREGVDAARRAMAAAGAAGARGGRRRRRPVEVRAWGVRSLALLRRAVEVGADGATVNWPHLGERALSRLRGVDGSWGAGDEQTRARRALRSGRPPNNRALSPSATKPKQMK